MPDDYPFDVRAHIDSRLDSEHAAVALGMDNLNHLLEERHRYFDAQVDALKREIEVRVAASIARTTEHRAFVDAEIAAVRELLLMMSNDAKGQVAALIERLETTAQALRSHIELQMETARLALAADKEATRLALEALMGLLAERDKALKNAREEQRITETKDRADLDVRLEAMNRFRNQIEQERGDYVRRDSFAQQIADMDRRVEQQFTVVGSRSDDRLAGLMGRLEADRDERQVMREHILRVDNRSEDNAKAISAFENNPLDMQSLRLRIDAVEKRPIALTPDEQGALKASVVEVQRDAARLHQDFHAQGNALQALKSAPTQFTSAEVKELMEVIKNNGVRNRRFTLFEAAVISGVVLTILSIIAVIVTKMLT